MTKRIVKLVDNRSCLNASVVELRGLIREIKSGDVTSLSFAIVRRDGSARTYFDSECAMRALGSVELLKDYIKHKRFKQS